MSSIQVVLRQKPNRYNEYPIAVRITKNRRSTYIFTGQYIDKKFWNKKKQRVRSSHPNSDRLNLLIITTLASCNEKLLELETSKKPGSLKRIKETIVNKEKKDFASVADNYLENVLSRKKMNQYVTDKKRIEVFKKFCSNPDLEFQEIDVSLLRNFENYLLYEKKSSKRTVVNYMICIRTIYNLAISENRADRNLYPFGRGKYQIRIPESQKVGLAVEEIKKLENASGLTSAQQHALNVWLISFYFAGIRITDVIQLKWSDFIDGRLYYRMNKNSKLVSMKIPFKAQKILDHYDKRNVKSQNLVFPELSGIDLNDEIRLRTRIKTITRNFNRHLKNIASELEITKNLSMHMSRHSFGNVSGDKIPVQMLQKLYRHSSITTTMRYQANFMSKEADEALDKVVDF